MKRIALGTVMLVAAVGLAVPAGAAAGTTPHVVATHGFGVRMPAHPGHGTIQRPRLQSPGVLPAAVDLTPWTVPVGNQGGLNACVPWAIDYAMLGWYSRREGHSGQPFAPMYVYSQIQAMHGWSDGGAYTEDGLQIAEQQGVDTRADYPQGDYDWRTQPTPTQQQHAAAHRTIGSAFLYQSWSQGPGLIALTSIKQAIATGHPVALSIPVYDAFEQLTPASPPLTDADIASSQLLGYHEVLAVGYDAYGVRIQNSWGTGWGDAGFADLAWDFVEQDTLEASVMTGFAADANDGPAVGSLSPAQGTVAGGRVVTIRGLGFSAATAVTFGASAATAYDVVDDTTIVATAPASAVAGSVPVRVTTPAGVSALAAARFTYLPPHVTSTSPAAGAARGGTLVTLTGSSLSQVTAATVGGLPVRSLAIVDDRHLRLTTPAHATGSASVRLFVGSSSWPAGAFSYLAAPVVSSLVRVTARVLVVRGLRLGPAPVVTFGTHRALVLWAGATAIRVRIPWGSGTVHVRVRTVFGTSAATWRNRFTY